MNNMNKFRSIVILLILITLSLTISYTYYFNHLAISQSSIIFNDDIYKDKTSLYFLIHNNTPSFFICYYKFFFKIGFSVNLINLTLTFISTFLYVSGIYLISKFITSSIILGLLISLTAIFLSKNLGDIDYPALIFHHHTAGVLSLSLSTFIFGLITLRNLSFAFLICLILSSIHLTVGIWMFGVLLFSSFVFEKNKNRINFLFIGITLSLVIIFYIYWFTNIFLDLPYEFNKKDYDEYFLNVEAHRTNYGNLNNFNLDYIFKNIIFNNNNLIVFKIYYKKIRKQLFFKTLLTSIILSGAFIFLIKFFQKYFQKL